MTNTGRTCNKSGIRCSIVMVAVLSLAAVLFGGCGWLLCWPEGIVDPAWAFRYRSVVLPLRSDAELTDILVSKYLADSLSVLVVVDRLPPLEGNADRIKLTVECDRWQLGSKPSYFPEEVSIIVGGRVMNGSGKPDEGYRRCRKLYSLGIVFSFADGPSDWLEADSSVDVRTLEIDLSRLVKYEGEYVPIETVYAIDSAAAWSRWKKEHLEKQ